MRSIIVLCLIFFSNYVSAKWPEWPQIEHADNKLGWQVNQKIIGHSSVVKLYGQDPFPFCAAFAASILHDQHECMSKGKDCTGQIRSSALSLVPASQLTSGKVNWDKGGQTILALRHILKNGGASSHLKCNYEFKEPRKNRSQEFTQLFGLYSGYRSYKNYEGYMKRYQRDEFIWLANNLFSTNVDLNNILNKDYNQIIDLMNAVLFNEDCNTIDIVSSKSYKSNLVENHKHDILLSFKTIEKLLQSKTPVGINLCLNASKGFKDCSKHSLVIFAESTAKNSITGDIRKVYRIANTWGEEWQKDHSNGWVFSDQLLKGVYEIFWLE